MLQHEKCKNLSTAKHSFSIFVDNAMCHCTETFLKISPQKFRRVRKEDAGEYYCQAKNDAGHAHCPAQMMEVCECLNIRVSVLRGHFCDLLTSKNKNIFMLDKADCTSKSGTSG